MVRGLVDDEGGLHRHRFAAAGLVLVLMNMAAIVPLWPGNVGLLQVAIAAPLFGYGARTRRASRSGSACRSSRCPWASASGSCSSDVKAVVRALPRMPPAVEVLEEDEGQERGGRGGSREGAREGATSSSLSSSPSRADVAGDDRREDSRDGGVRLCQRPKLPRREAPTLELGLALTVAERGPSSTSATSPNEAPGPRSAISRSPRLAFALPD